MRTTESPISLLGLSPTCRIVLFLLFVHSFPHGLPSLTEHVRERGVPQVMSQSDDFIKAIDRRQAKRSDDRNGFDQPEYVATGASAANTSVTSAGIALRKNNLITPIASHLLHTQETASSL